MAEKKPFLLRLPPDLWDELQRWAADDLRSVNGQLEYLLRRAVEARRRSGERPERLPPPSHQGTRKKMNDG